MPDRRRRRKVVLVIIISRNAGSEVLKSALGRTLPPVSTVQTFPQSLANWYVVYKIWYVFSIKIVVNVTSISFIIITLDYNELALSPERFHSQCPNPAVQYPGYGLYYQEIRVCYPVRGYRIYFIFCSLSRPVWEPPRFISNDYWARFRVKVADAWSWPLTSI